MSVNIADIAELIAQESRQAQKYEELEIKAENETFKNSLKELRVKAVESLNLLTRIIKEGPWGDWK